MPNREFARKRKFKWNENKVRQKYQNNTNCLFLSLRNQSDLLKYSDQCRPWEEREKTCNVADKFYSINKDIYCTVKPRKTNKNVCSVTFSIQGDQRPVINCDKEFCQGGNLFVGSVNPKIGLLTSQDWKTFLSVNSTELALPEIISENVKNGLNFCLIRCVKKNEIIDQLLTFPHASKKHHLKKWRKNRKRKIRSKQKRHQKQRGRNLFNINIVMLDSVSRHHFYRMLKKTVNTLQEIMLRPDMLVLDYELMQSLAPYTYLNVKALFSGSVSEKHLNENIGVEKFFDHFKQLGYRTLFQEDSCWYDKWGSVLESNIRKEKMPGSLKEFKKSWKNFKKRTKTYSVDDYGLTHFSCVVFTMHGITNMFNKPLKVCYDGQPISSHFLRYVKDFMNRTHSRKNMRPVISYLHTNFGHEGTGLRIKSLDEEFAEFVRDFANQKNTVTILLSDHGPKTTVYSRDYLRGRLETYDSLLFMIIPKNVQEELGNSRIAALVKNQKSLITMQDIHKMIIEMTQLHQNHEHTGLFSHISNRTCDSIKMVNYGMCKCRDWERIFIDQSPQFLWLAEFVTELLNTKISEQFLRSNQSGSGKCLKLRLHRIWNIRQRTSNISYVTTFDLVVQPFYTIFLVQTRHTEINGIIDNLQLQSWRRVSLFRRYLSCKDKTVDIGLCVCKLTHENSNKRLLRIIEDARDSKNQELINTGTSCLYIVLTKAEEKLESIFSYDVINTCAIRYMFTVDKFSNVDNFQNRKIIKILDPNIDTFLFSISVKRKRKPIFKYYFKEQT